MATQGVQQVLLSGEVEVLIEGLKPFSVKDIGSTKWQKQHEYIEKLNMQALLNASAQEEEFVKEILINLDKIPCLILDLITTEIWKQYVFKVIIKTNFKPKTTIPLYMVLYHEATLINLLETVLFHKESWESAEDSALDLLDYCYRKLVLVVASSEKKQTGTEENNINNMQELVKQHDNIDFEIAVKVVSILRYLSDAFDGLPLSAMSRAMNTHNLPCLLVKLIDQPPWTKKEKGCLMKFIDGKWKEVNGPELLTLTKVEGQIWLTLYNLLMNPDCNQKYDFNSYNKTQILKLRSHMTEVLLDQLPILAEMRRYLEELAMTDSAPPKKDLVLEQIPEIKNRLQHENEGKWAAIAKYQMKNYFDPSQEEIQRHAQRLADAYNFDVMESLLNEVPKCAVCGAEAAKRCSQCRQEWYCKRECQVKHWPKHKGICKVMTGANNN